MQHLAVSLLTSFFLGDHSLIFKFLEPEAFHRCSLMHDLLLVRGKQHRRLKKCPQSKTKLQISLKR